MYFRSKYSWHENLHNKSSCLYVQSNLPQITVYKGQSHFPWMNRAYNLNLHIRSNCSIKGTFSVSIECPLYTGFTVFQQEMILMCKCTWKRTISKFKKINKRLRFYCWISFSRSIMGIPDISMSARRIIACIWKENKN